MEAPDDGDGGDDEEVEPFEEEAVPESQLSGEGDRVGEEGDVPLGSVRRGRDVLLGLRQRERSAVIEKVNERERLTKAL